MNDGKIFLILGASSDLGIALIKRLDAEYTNSTFCLHYNSDASVMEKIVFTNGNKPFFIKADFTIGEDVEAMVKSLKDKDLIPTHIVHLPASKLSYTRLKDFDIERVNKNLKIQVYSFVEIMKAFLPAMAKRKDHNKVVVVSSSVVNGAPPKAMLEYTAVKYMLTGVVKQLAVDYTGKMVNINSVSPSMIETKLLSEVDPRIVELAAQASPEGRNANVSDVVPAISFLLSEDSNYLNGVNLNVTNGSVIV